jgi:cellulose synthase/poly-beta-1,6-N-acetylglucosamine synthase-like glycosyltransferase
LYILSKFVLKRGTNNSSYLPSVSIIITAYNEAKDIGEKIRNTLSLDYPEDKIEIIVGSDGSTDKTNEIVSTFSSKGVKLIAFPENRGKTMTQNDCVKVSKNDIIVFMDAASFCQKDALKCLVNRFSDKKVGVVAGKLVFVESKDNLTVKSQGLYWKYEMALKASESTFGALVGVDGPFYAIRKELYQALDSDMISDFITPLLVRQLKYNVVLEHNAITFEEPTIRTTDEFRTRRRITLRGLIALFRYPDLLNPFRNFFLSFQLISHKILRWFVGAFFLSMVFSSLFLLNNVVYVFFACASTVFVLFAGLGMMFPKIKISFFSIPYYFILVNFAALFGTVDFMRGKKIISWKPVRD